MMLYLHAQATITARTIQRLSPCSFAMVVAIAYQLRPVTKHCVTEAECRAQINKGPCLCQLDPSKLGTATGKLENPTLPGRGRALMKAQNIHQLQSRETKVWFARPKKKKYLPLIQMVNLKYKQDGEPFWHLSLACSSSTLMESEGCFFTAWD